jgi:predicted helicase
LSIEFRPYVKRFFYSDKVLNDRLTENHYEIFGINLGSNNFTINLSDARASKPFHLVGTSSPTDYHYSADTVCLPLYRYDKDGSRHDNITDWGLQQFLEFYGRGGSCARPVDCTTNVKGGNPQGDAPTNSEPSNADITREDIFH